MAAAYSLVRDYMDSLLLAWIVRRTSCHSTGMSRSLRAASLFNSSALLAVPDIAGAAWASFWRGRSKFFHPMSMLWVDALKGDRTAPEQHPRLLRGALEMRMHSAKFSS